MDIDYAALASIIGLITAVCAVVTLFLEERRGRIMLQADLLLKLDERFSGQAMCKKRRIAAQKLLKKESPNNELDDLLDYFDTVANLLEQKALNTKLTYKTHEYWIIRYWYSAKEHVAGARHVDPESWLTLEHLVNKLETQRMKMGQRPIVREELDRFLREEASY